MTKIVGLTGGIATGKTTVSTILRQAGIPVIDADQVDTRLGWVNADCQSIWSESTFTNR